jgi:hypothetical protein
MKKGNCRWKRVPGIRKERRRNLKEIKEGC